LIDGSMKFSDRVAYELDRRLRAPRFPSVPRVAEYMFGRETWDCSPRAASRERVSPGRYVRDRADGTLAFAPLGRSAVDRVVELQIGHRISFKSSKDAQLERIELCESSGDVPLLPQLAALLKTTLRRRWLSQAEVSAQPG
jgi:hypothetical protein